MFQGKGSYDFKKCRMRIPIADAFANFSETERDTIFGNHFAVYPNPFAKGDEVRGGKQTGAITGGATDCVDHSADGTLPVRAGDVNDGTLADQRKGGALRGHDCVIGGRPGGTISQSSALHDR